MTSQRRVAAILGLCCAGLAGCFGNQAPPTSMAALPVRSELLAPRTFRPSLELLGVVRPAATVELRAGVSGVIAYPPRFLQGLRDGEAVAAGEAVAILQNEQARYAVAEARLGLEAAQVELDRSRKASSLGVGTQVERDKAELEQRRAQEKLASVERQSADARIVAPQEGTLVLVQTPPAAGSYVAAGTEIAELHPAGSPLRIEAHAPGAEGRLLAAGMGVRIRASGPPTMQGGATLSGAAGDAGRGEVPGRIVEVGGVVEEAGTIRVVAELLQEGSGLMPGEGVEIVVDLAESADALVVPEEALVVGEGGYAVFTLRAAAFSAGRFVAARTAVTLGGRSGGHVRVAEGLRAGDRIVVAGTAFIDEGTLVSDPALERTPSGTAAAATPPAGAMTPAGATQ